MGYIFTTMIDDSACIRTVLNSLSNAHLDLAYYDKINQRQHFSCQLCSTTQRSVYELT